MVYWGVSVSGCRFYFLLTDETRERILATSITTGRHRDGSSTCRLTRALAVRHMHASFSRGAKPPPRRCRLRAKSGCLMAGRNPRHGAARRAVPCEPGSGCRRSPPSRSIAPGQKGGQNARPRRRACISKQVTRRRLAVVNKTIARTGGAKTFDLLVPGASMEPV